MTKPLYVERDGQQLIVRPPFLQSDTFLTGWLIKADTAALQRMLDVAFNIPSGHAVDYRPLFSSVLFTFADIPEVSSLDPRDAHYGYAPEGDVCIWVVVGSYVDGLLDRIFFYLPYIIVTDPVAVTIGREVFGFPKMLGWAELPKKATDTGPFWGDTYVIPTFSPTSPIERKRFVEVSRGGAMAAALAHEDDPGSGGYRELVKAISARMREHHADPAIADDIGLCAEILKDILEKRLPCIFLKQFRDAETSDRACYQSFVHADATIKTISGIGLLPPDWTFKFWQYDSFKIIDTLGIAPTQVVDLGFWLSFTFSMDLGKEVWRAP